MAAIYSTPQPRLATSLGMSLAQITAQFSPIPGYNLIVDILCSIVQVCDNVVQNRHATRQLANRCHSLVQALKEAEMRNTSPNIASAKKAVEGQLLHIRERMERWNKMGKIKSFLNQDDISREIVDSHTEISDCISKFQLQSQIEILEWQQEFSSNVRLDHQELVASMSKLQETQETTRDLAQENNDMLRSLMVLMQAAMGENKQIAEKIQEGLSLNLYQLQQQTSELLPDRNLSSGEVKRIGDFPLAGTATMDIYQGLYLQKEKVSMKAIRSMKADERSRQRFVREGEIWAKVWKRDRGHYIVPFYGFCQTEGPFPYMISPWQKNGDALSYVKANDSKIDYIDFLRRIALGVQVLHTFDPPIVHGDIKLKNILINDEGNPRLTDFGLSQVINDVSGTPFTQSSIIADSFRYFAPEVCQGSGRISTMSDIYALGMTALELFTHQQPYRKVRHHTEAVLKAARGVKPDQPLESEVRDRGLSDSMWELLLECWSLETEKRPQVHKFISVLESQV